MDKFKEVLKYIFLISIVWAIIIGIIVFKFTDSLQVKNLQIQTLGFVVGELSKDSCGKEK
ncbi:MAG: hypothetical protein AABX29_07200 [Nanoarchaeota archaeon]